eukprot:3645418-Lingulodinium_polyedra.AAC.1
MTQPLLDMSCGHGGVAKVACVLGRRQTVKFDAGISNDHGLTNPRILREVCRFCRTAAAVMVAPRAAVSA